MFTRDLENALSSVFQLPIFPDTDAASACAPALSYEIASGVSVRYEGGALSFECLVSVLYVAPRPSPALGVLSVALADIDRRVEGVQLSPHDCAELVEFQNATRTIVSKALRVAITIEKNRIREPIKKVNLNE